MRAGRRMQHHVAHQPGNLQRLQWARLGRTSASAPSGYPPASAGGPSGRSSPRAFGTLADICRPQQIGRG
eukprot:scaffold1496_cov110-Isochrysis_galbana.AAC.14